MSAAVPGPTAPTLERRGAFLYSASPYPSEWRVYSAGRAVLCPGTRDRRAPGRHHQGRRCHREFWRVGRGKELRIRIVGDTTHRVPPSITGDLHHCHECGTWLECESRVVAKAPELR